MVKSTYQPSASALPPLLPGWTEHKAPTGHTYYYNAGTKESTYKRPSAAPPAMPAPGPSNPAMSSYVQHQTVPQMNLSDPKVANAFMAHMAGASRTTRPKTPATGASPEKLMPGILELDTARIRQKAEGTALEQPKQNEEAAEPAKTSTPAPEVQAEEPTHDYDSSEYEEVEVTDDEGAEVDEAEEGGARKRQRTEDPSGAGPAEFTEADFAAQLAAMGAEYDDIEMGEGGAEEWEEGDEGLPLSDEDARELFKDLLNDFHINPYSPWEKLMEEGKVFDDARYTVLPTTKARKEVWEEWTREKIQLLKEQRAKEEKKDPRIGYMAFLQEKATPKLYWPEFKRKYKREDPMKDPKLADKDREKWYREHISRLKLPQTTLKADLKKLLDSVPLSALNNQTTTTHLPPQILCDIRYISLDPKVRDPFLEGYIQGLGPPPAAEEAAAEQEDEAAKKAHEERRKRERALEERERAVAEEKRRQEKQVAFQRARLREEERELERAMRVDKKGLQSQLVGERQAPAETS
ncbi:hypothetical protein N0V88_007309 [Collariella sp. IMI 366227]|nr:hypothetical protein N0V88_007309 [Collariella sp. IMI 366227]